MNPYVTGAVIKKLREHQNMTQAALAEILGVSDKAVSKWETGRGYPDITLVESIANALGVSSIELLSGNRIENNNVSSNIMKSKFYVCPVCGNIIHSVGEAVVSCCGILLPALEAEDFDEKHELIFEAVEDETFITANHDMTKNHYVSFIAFASSDKLELKKLYPEGNAEARFKLRGHGFVYLYCNKDGLFRKRI